MLGSGRGVLTDDRRSIVQFSENGMTYKGININNRRVIRYQVDGGLISDDRKRCDNALAMPEINTVYFVELKGEDIRKAAVQIAHTVSEFNNELKNSSVFGRIICSRIPRPDIRSSEIVSLERTLAAKGGNLVKSCQALTENI